MTRSRHCFYTEHNSIATSLNRMTLGRTQPRKKQSCRGAGIYKTGTICLDMRLRRYSSPSKKTTGRLGELGETTGRRLPSKIQFLPIKRLCRFIDVGDGRRPTQEKLMSTIIQPKCGGADISAKKRPETVDG